MASEAELAISWIQGKTRETPELRAFEAYRNAHPHALQPALFFEAHTGITGIAGRYTYPPEGPQAMEQAAREIYTPLNDMMNAMREHIHGGGEVEGGLNQMDEAVNIVRPRLAAMLQRLEQLNPELTTGLQINRNDTRDLFNTISGVASGFSIRDINYHINRFDRAIAQMPLGRYEFPQHLRQLRTIDPEVADNTERQLALAEQFAGRFGFKGLIRWNAAPETLQSMEDQLGQDPTSRANGREITPPESERER